MVRFSVVVTPRASTDAVEGVDDSGVLRLCVRAVPAEGKANESARRVIAKDLGIGASRVTVEAGARSRNKLIGVDDVDRSDVERRWPGLRMR